MITKARRRYILLNFGLWCLVAAAGVIGIGLLRQYGSALAGREKARALLTRAESHYREGDLNSCQDEIKQALAASPGLVTEVLDRFGTRMIALPTAAEELETLSARSDPPGLPQTLAMARLAIMRGNLSQASKKLIQYFDEGGRDPMAYLWRARLELEAADFHQARDDFSRYWQAHRDLRKRLLAQLRSRLNGAGAGQRVQNARTLFWAGLWNPAFTMVNEARQKGARDPELDFFEGVSLDLAGKTAQARAEYLKTLTKLPNHLLSLRRLDALAHHTAANAPS